MLWTALLSKASDGRPTKFAKASFGWGSGASPLQPQRPQAGSPRSSAIWTTRLSGRCQTRLFVKGWSPMGPNHLHRSCGKVSRSHRAWSTRVSRKEGWSPAFGREVHLGLQYLWVSLLIMSVTLQKSFSLRAIPSMVFSTSFALSLDSAESGRTRDAPGSAQEVSVHHQHREAMGGVQEAKAAAEPVATPWPQSSAHWLSAGCLPAGCTK